MNCTLLHYKDFRLQNNLYAFCFRGCKKGNPYSNVLMELLVQQFAYHSVALQFTVKHPKDIELSCFEVSSMESGR